MSCRIAECPEEALDEVKKAVLLGDFRVCPEGAESQKRHAVLAEGKAVSASSAPSDVIPVLSRSFWDMLLVASRTT